MNQLQLLKQLPLYYVHTQQDVTNGNINAFSTKMYNIEKLISEASQWTLEVEKDFLQIFPAEVWTKIFEKCPSDVVSSLSRKSLFIRKWVFLQRTSYLFPQVWNILCRWYTKFLEDKLLEEETHQARQIGFAARFQEQRYDFNRTQHVARQILHETLKLRLVCKNWRTGIDQCQFYVKRDVIFHDSYDILKFENTFMQRPKTELPKRLSNSIVIGMLNSEVSISNTLRFIGRSVWHCTIQINDLFDTEHEKYFMLRQALELMPNLKTLEVTYEHPNWNKSSLALDQLVEAVAAYPLKKLDRLTSFTTDNLPYPIFNEMLKQNRQLHSSFALGKCSSYDMVLNSLHSRHVSFRLQENSEEFVLMFKQSNVVKLQLYSDQFNNYRNVKYWSLTELQKIIQKYTWISLELVVESTM